MANNTVTISGMFGGDKTYFADSPVVIDISGLEWPESSPFKVVRVEVLYNSNKVGDFRADTGGQTTATFDISSALCAIWSDFDFKKEVGKAQDAKDSAGASGFTPSEEEGVYNANGVRLYREYSLKVYTEYLSPDDGGVYTTTSYGPFTGGRCMVGGLTEWERSNIGAKENADASHWEHSNLRNGDASTKPTSSPERVGSNSITSWVDVNNNGTQSVFYPASATPEADGHTAHVPIVLRDSQPYVDFLFLNRRGAIETCSGLTKEAMSIDVDVKQYSRTERPSFKPTRSLMAIGSDGRRSWQMSSGYVTREWAEWWTMEFLGGKRKRWWMLWQGPGLSSPRYVPVTIKPAKSGTGIYDRQKQQMPHVDFTVTLALEG